MRTRANPWALPLLVIPVLLCGCCVWSLLGAEIQLALGQSALTFLGQPASGTISAILPCRSGVELSGDASNPLAFSFGTAGTSGNTVRVRYTDAAGREREGQTVACTQLDPAATVGQPIALIYRDGDPSAILLEKDHSIYRTAAINSAIAIGLALLGLLALVLPWQPAQGRDPDEVRALSLRAAGPNNYATQRIGLKEALVLLALRRTDDPLNDHPKLRENSRLLNDHMVVAAMLMELVAFGRIEIRAGSRRPAAGSIVVLDAAPVGEPDLDTLLRELSTGGGARLGHFYLAHSRRRVARLIAQLRQGGYVKLHEPKTGRFSPPRLGTRSPLAQWLATVLAPAGFDRGMVVPDDKYLISYPWYLLYTTHTEAEERMFERAQEAVASHGAGDDFTRHLLLLVAALYVARNQFPRRYATAKSLYRFYPPERRWEIIRFVRELARTAAPSEQAIYLQAKQVDDRIENPPSGG
ncbi:MAG TPA: GPP34 family phosphoprotein [Ktedonobacterales bacterium]|nr:GPP34 family phosphoprotein [Ktedonobacterales bacterium]